MNAEVTKILNNTMTTFHEVRDVEVVLADLQRENIDEEEKNLRAKITDFVRRFFR